MNYEKIGKFIQEKRKEKNLTQKELATRIGVTDKAISKWERGLGCPDVSILEVLSKELGCSILELLKGREILNEVIPVTEADDYVRESIIFSKKNYKDKIKNILNKIIVSLVIFIVLLLGYLNIIQIIYIDKEYTFTADRNVNKKVVSKVNDIESNFEIIKNNQGVLSDDDYKEIINNLDEYYNKLNKIKVLNYLKTREKITYTVTDLILLEKGGYYVDCINNIIDILDKYDNNTIDDYKYVYLYNWFSRSEANSSNALKGYFTYKYQLTYSKDIGEELFNLGNNNLYSIEYYIESELYNFDYLVKLIMEVGDIHE